MTTVCAWCLRDMGEKEPLEDTRITHSICPSCYEALKPKEEPVYETTN